MRALYEAASFLCVINTFHSYCCRSSCRQSSLPGLGKISVYVIHREVYWERLDECLSCTSENNRFSLAAVTRAQHKGNSVEDGIKQTKKILKQFTITCIFFLALILIQCNERTSVFTVSFLSALMSIQSFSFETFPRCQGGDSSEEDGIEHFLTLKNLIC